ncbi:MAG: hypothetical protein JXR69_00090 [Candidatus Delongbacteria bacterium]|nr:hypothetical protein [Candidatus Delongbacteria bacterium]
MKRVMFFTLVLSILTLISCAKKKNSIEKNEDGVSIYKNSTSPSNPNFTYEFIEDGTIPFFEGENNEERDFKQPTAVIEDKDGNIFVAGSNVAKIFKFSPDYKFINSFGGKGLGPGEFEGGPSSLTYHRGQLLAPCWRNTSTNVYDTDGNFIEKIPPGINAGFSGQISFNNRMLMNTESRKDDDNEAIVTSSIVLIDTSFKSIDKIIYEKDTRTLLRTFRVSDMYVRFAAGKDIFYVGDVSENAYKIFGYDKNFTKTMEIKKKYRSEIEEDSMAVVYSFNPDNLGGSFDRKYKTNAKDRTLYYKSINHMFVDENDRLWVVSPTKNKKDQKGLYVDIFEKGIYLNTIYLPFYQSKDFSYVYSAMFLRNGKLFYVDRDNACIRVYTYQDK